MALSGKGPTDQAAMPGSLTSRSSLRLASLFSVMSSERWTARSSFCFDASSSQLPQRRRSYTRDADHPSIADYAVIVSRRALGHMRFAEVRFPIFLD